MPTADRRLEVLRAIVEDFIATNEPVGSKNLADRHNLGVSPATIRNDMAVLEEEGLIAQPHTSAGRIPTDAGYRMFVDRLTELKPLSAAEKRAIQTFLDGAADLDDVLHRAVRLLAQVTRHVAVVQYPSLSRSRVRHLELVSLTASKLMLVLITDTGRVEQRVVDLPVPVADEAVFELRATLNQRLRDRLLSEAPEVIGDLPAQVAPELRGLLATLTTVLLETLIESHSDRIVLGGTANLTGQRTRLPGDPARPRGARGAGRAAAAARPVGHDQPGRRADRQRDPARGPDDDLGGDQRLRRQGCPARGGRRARPTADGLRAHHGTGGGGRTLRGGARCRSGRYIRSLALTFRECQRCAEDGLWLINRATTTGCSVSVGTRPPRRSSGPTAGWPVNCTRT